MYVTTFDIGDAVHFDFSCLNGQNWNIQKEELAKAEETIRRAARAVTAIRETGTDMASGEMVRFPHLPYILDETLLMTEEERHRLAELPQLGKKADAVISLGIGGSYLGNQVIFDTACGEFWNLMEKEERHGRPQVFFAGQNEDPARLTALVQYLKRQAEKKNGPFHVVVLVISKSGTTIEPMSALDVLRRKLPLFCKNISFVAVTDKRKGCIHDLAEREGWQRFTVPEGIGGRFSVFSQVGLTLASLIGADVNAFLAGARLVEESCQEEEMEKNPALFLAALKYVASTRHGITAEVVMPYCEGLRSFGSWYAQLLGESLGKKSGTDGTEIHYGRTPVSAVGTTDMHSLTQEHQEGKNNKLLQFISVREPAAELDVAYEEGALSEHLPMSRILEAARMSNEKALASAGRMSCSIGIKKHDLFHVGALMYFFFLAIAYEGAMAGVNAYNQPGVEAYKTILHGYLRRQAE